MDDSTLRGRFYDSDILKDQFLGESALNAQGVAGVIIDSSAFPSGMLGLLFERLKERRPGVFCEIVDADGRPRFRTAVLWNVDVAQFNELTQRHRPTVDLGTFAYRFGEGLTDPHHYAGIPRPLM